MFQRIRNMFRPDLQPMNVIKIYKDNILFNYGLLQWLHPDDSIFPVLKSNAYGHWLKEVLRIIERLPVPYVVVDSVPEYYVVKNNSNKHVLLLWETLVENYDELDFERVTPCVWSIEVLEKLLNMKKKMAIHVFINTWMNREGLSEGQLKVFLKKIEKHKYGKNIFIEWVLSHFASADDAGFENIDQQVAAFKKMYQTILDYGHAPSYRHIGNSAATLKMDDKFFNAWRPGLAFMGYNPLTTDDEAYVYAKTLKPAMSITTRVVAVQTIKAWETVGYNWKRHAPSDTKVITVPFGYTEWMMRSMSNKIFAWYKSEFLPQIWSICMNLSCFAIPDNTKIAIWDEVELLSHDKDAYNSIMAWSQAANTIQYEVLVGIDGGLRREVVIE